MSKSKFLVASLSVVLLSSSYISSAEPNPGTLQFSQATFNVHENEKVATIEVTREGGSDGKVSVNYTTADGTAVAGNDYNAKLGKLTWQDGETDAKTFKVNIINDQVFNEGYETASLTLTEATGGASLGTQNEATLRIADDDCGTNNPDAQNPHWVDTCPSGSDEFLSEATVNIAFGASCLQDDDSGIYKVKLKGPARAFRKDGTPHTIETEMYDMELTGTTPFGPVVMRAGDGVGNRENDGEFYSPGEVNEQPGNPMKANSFFNILFELDTPMGTLHNAQPFKMEATDLITVPPVRLKREDGTFYVINYLHPSYTSHIVLELLDTNNKLAACFKVEEIGVPAVIHRPTRLDVELTSFTATANEEQVSIAWETGVEENNAAFRVWRGTSLTGLCSENPNDYTEVTPITSLIPAKGSIASGAVYSDVVDSNVVHGVTYCYALEDIDNEGNPTFHMDRIIPVTVD